MSNVQNASRSSAFAAVEGDHWVESSTMAATC